MQDLNLGLHTLSWCFAELCTSEVAELNWAGLGLHRAVGACVSSVIVRLFETLNKNAFLLKLLQKSGSTGDIDADSAIKPGRSRDYIGIHLHCAFMIVDYHDAAASYAVFNSLQAPLDRPHRPYSTVLDVNLIDSKLQSLQRQSSLAYIQNAVGIALPITRCIHMVTTNAPASEVNRGCIATAKRARHLALMML